MPSKNLSSQTLSDGKTYLAQQGLKLFSVLKTAALTDDIIKIFENSSVPIGEYANLVLIGHAGTDFWQALKQANVQGADPVDSFSIEITQNFIANYLGSVDYEWLYPSTDYIIPLQRLARLANWSQQSPLGLDISPIYGLWFAHRACFLSNADLEAYIEESQASPCDSCITKDCMTACPASAVTESEFSIEACIGYRVGEGSSCADTCLSRRACPYFPEHQYTEEQMNYHYSVGFENTKAWYKSKQKL